MAAVKLDPAKRFEHLRDVISSQRFLQMKGLNNDLPFYICEFEASTADEMRQQRQQLTKALGNLHVDCLGKRGVKVLEVNLYDLSVELLQAREGSHSGQSLWQQLLETESDMAKEALLETLQNVLDVEAHFIPAIGKRMQDSEFDVLFLTGIGEVFPWIRSHNILNNLQSTAKDKPTVMFFPGQYRHTQEQGASLDLFGELQDDKYYRAFNIFEVHA